MKVIKKLAIVTVIITCILAVMPQKTNAIDLTGVMTGADNFLEGAENRELFDKDVQKERC